MDEGQRKIELQSQEDLAYLINNVRAAARARLDEAFPSVEGQSGSDELRDQIEALVNDYITQTFTLASPSLSINGLDLSSNSWLDPTPTETAYESFDSRKRARVTALITQEEKLLEEVAALKRAVPATAAKETAEGLKAALEGDARAVEERVTAAGTKGEVEAGELPGALDRQEGVKEAWKRAIEGLGKLKSDMPAIVARMERARVAGEYVVTDGR